MKRLLLLTLTLISTTLLADSYSTSSTGPAGKSLDRRQAPITPEAGPRVDHGIDAFITASFIYWTSRMDGMGYVGTGLGSGAADVSAGYTRHPDWSWDPGFKVGIGLNLPHDGWDVSAQYTWLHSNASHSIKGTTLYGTWDIANLGSTLTAAEFINEARGSWHHRFNVIDLELGRNYFISRNLTLRPFVGFKGSWQDQNYRVRYLGSDANLSTNVKMSNDQDFWGIGMRAGLNTAWHFIKSWSFYGDFALSALWSGYDVKRKDSRLDFQNSGTPPPIGVEVKILDTDNDFHTIKGVIEFGMGLRGEWWFWEDRYHILIQAGWEEQVWINHNNLIRLNFHDGATGDLVLQGLTVKTRFDF